MTQENSKIDDTVWIAMLAEKLLKYDPNLDQSIEYRIAALDVARAALQAEQNRRVQMALLSKALR